jgi:hypothetical protein
MTAEYTAETANNLNSKSKKKFKFFPLTFPFSVSSFTLLSFIALYFGWSNRDEYFYTAESGLGYSFGIVGGLMMLLLLVYPLRKRFNSSLFVFSTKAWFKLHMMLGVVGPLLIMYHCNFNLGSTNSNIALGSMLLMVTSGLIGRFIYGKIHHGLYGNKIQLKELLNHQLLTKKEIDTHKEKDIVHIDEVVVEQLKSYETSILGSKGFFYSLFRVFVYGIKTRLSYWLLIKKIVNDQKVNDLYVSLPKNEQRKNIDNVKKHISEYLATVRKIIGLNFYDRLFSLWHMLHLPIFFMLIITGFVHVYAVHAY